MIPKDKYHGWCDRRGRVLTADEWADDHERSAAIFESRGQDWLARVCRDRAARIRKHGLEGAGRPPVAAVIGGLG